MIFLVSVKAVKLVESTKMIESTMMEISTEVFEVSKLLVHILITIEKKFLSGRRFERIKVIERKVNRLFHDTIKYKDTKCDDNVILGIAYLLIFWIYNKILEDEESINFKRTCLIRCLELLKGKELDHTVILLAIRVLNNLGNTYLSSDKPEDSIPIFDKAIQLYLKYTEGKEVYPIPVNVLTIFGIDENKKSKILLEEAYILVLKRLMKANERIFQADECTLILYKLKYLNQQLMYIPLIKGYLQFIIELLSISEYFLSHNYFTKARNCLAAASWMLQRFYLKGCKKDVEEFLGEKVLMNIMHQNMDKILAKYWGRYGLALLRLSVERLLQSKEENESVEANNLKLEPPIKFNEQFNELTIFADIEDLKEYTKLITDKYLTHYADAKKVFTLLIYWFDKAKVYYTPDKYKIEYVTIVQDVSKAYKYFAYYEEDLGKQISLHSVRISTLESVSKILNKHHYNILKQIWIELAVTYSTLLDISVSISYMYGLEILKSDIDKFATLSMLNFQLYLN